MLEAEVVGLLDDYDNDEDEGIFDSPPSKKRRDGIGIS